MEIYKKLLKQEQIDFTVLLIIYVPFIAAFFYLMSNNRLQKYLGTETHFEILLPALLIVFAFAILWIIRHNIRMRKKTIDSVYEINLFNDTEGLFKEYVENNKLKLHEMKGKKGYYNFFETKTIINEFEGFKYTLNKLSKEIKIKDL